MKYIQPTPNSSGAYPAPQSTPFPGAIPLTEEQAQTVVDYNGYVTITSSEETIVDDFTRTVYEVTPNTEAWEAWKQEEAEKTEPKSTPSLDERVDELETTKADKTEVAAVWDQMAAAYSEGVQEA